MWCARHLRLIRTGGMMEIGLGMPSVVRSSEGIRSVVVAAVVIGRVKCRDAQCRCAVFWCRNVGVLQWIARWDVVISLELVHVDVTVGIPRKVLTRRRAIVASVVMTAVLWKVVT